MREIANDISLAALSMRKHRGKRIWHTKLGITNLLLKDIWNMHVKNLRKICSQI